ncbi:chromate transporter [Bacillus sp. B1-b2]|uniref:chromate transporter n=1 Tax=Bacillus sp. B1-b2 TaxID=2653201 RepID=UPI001261A721|nr:chromate transporter [Bacillus sp. B1-b2]KAB7666448.1 chromate transporter [Bacillus sp. B1-b2]
MIIVSIFLSFLVANILGYGGGPASIPLMYEEIVNRYNWLSNTEFSNMLALGNALPGPIATKIAAYVGFGVGGTTGFIVALIATVVPSAIALILLIKVMSKHKDSSIVKGMTILVQPVITALMLVLTFEMFQDSYHSMGIFQSLIIALVAFLLLQKWKIHPAFVVLLAFLYGGLIIPHFS